MRHRKSSEYGSGMMPDYSNLNVTRARARADSARAAHRRSNLIGQSKSNVADLILFFASDLQNTV